MGEPKKDSGHNVSRRDFIKLSGVGLGVMAFRPMLNTEAPVEEEKWKKDRFFENIEDFDSSKFLDIRGELLQFGDTYENILKSNEQTANFDIEEWAEGVKKSTRLLKRISDVYKNLKNEGPLDPKAEELLKRDFYDAGSVLWAVLRVNEKFRDKPEEFENALNNPFINKVTGVDPFMGKEMATISSDWADVLRRIDFFGTSKVVDLFNGSYLNLTAENSWWQEVKGPAGLLIYKKDPKIPRRPSQISVMVDKHPELNEAVLDILESARLDRVAIDLRVSQWPEGNWQGTYLDMVPQNEQLMRDIEIFIEGEPGSEMIKKYPFLFTTMVVHEAGHGLWELIPYGQSDAKVFNNRVKIEKMLDLFRPWLTLQKFFQPQGNFYSEKVMEDDTISLEEWDKECGTANMVTLTDYASGVHVKDDLYRIGRIFKLPKYVLEQDTFCYRIIDNNDITASKAILDAKTFKEAWAEFQNQIKDSPNMPKLNAFETYLFEEINKNITLFESPEKTNYLFKNWLGYLKDTVVPLVAKHLYLDNPSKFKTKFLESLVSNNLDHEFIQSIDNAMLISNNQRSPFTESYYRTNLVGDTELFAVIVAYNNTRKIKGFKNEIPDKVWDQVDMTINHLINDLIEDELAVSPNPITV